MIYTSRKGMALMLTAASALMLIGCQQGVTQKNSQAVAMGERYSLVSEVLGEEREYLVYLPKSYGNETAASRAGSASIHRSSSQLPKTLVTPFAFAKPAAEQKTSVFFELRPTEFYKQNRQEFSVDFIVRTWARIAVRVWTARHTAHGRVVRLPAVNRTGPEYVHWLALLK